MRLVPAIVFLLAAPVGALAHGGHVGELAGHSHWVGVAAIFGAAAVAAVAARLRKREKQSEDEARAEAEAEDQAAEEPA